MAGPITLLITAVRWRLRIPPAGHTATGLTNLANLFLEYVLPNDRAEQERLGTCVSDLTEPRQPDPSSRSPALFVPIVV